MVHFQCEERPSPIKHKCPGRANKHGTLHDFTSTGEQNINLPQGGRPIPWVHHDEIHINATFFHGLHKRAILLHNSLTLCILHGILPLYRSLSSAYGAFSGNSMQIFKNGTHKLQEPTKKSSRVSYPLNQYDFWLGAGYLQYKTFHVWSVSSACLEAVWEVRTKTHILYRLIKGQTHFGMPSRGANMSLALNEPK